MSLFQFTYVAKLKRFKTGEFYSSSRNTEDILSKQQQFGSLVFWDMGFTSFSHLTPPMNDKDFEWEGFTPMAVIAIMGAAKPRVVHRAVSQTFVSPVI